MNQLFLASVASDVLDDIVIHLSKKPPEYKIAFIPTASEVYTGDLWWIKKDKQKLISLGFNLIEFSITDLNKNQIEEKLKDIDIIFVCGGNVFYLLDQSIKSGFNQILLEKYKNNNLIYIGSSAGSMIPGQHIELVSTLDDQSKAPDLKSDGIGLIDLTILPHWGNSKFKDEYISGINSIYNIEAKAVLIRDNQYLLIENNNQKLIQF
jgi:dipeptidase E